VLGRNQTEAVAIRNRQNAISCRLHIHAKANKWIVGSEVLTAVSTKMAVFWVVATTQKTAIFVIKWIVSENVGE
jgi:hypothetical protein